MCDFRVIEDDWANDPSRCSCKPAIFKAYQGMLESGVPEKTALAAAYRVYIHHHPEDRGMAGQLTVQRWLSAQNLH